MRVIADRLKNKIKSGATELCMCWQITRTDGTQIGVTDHDNDVMFDGMFFDSRVGWEGTAIEAKSGLSPDNMEVMGVLSSNAITEEDIIRGLYDRASVRQWLVDWRDTELHMLIFTGEFGEITRTGHSFRVELLGLSESLNRRCSKCVIRKCQARLGDKFCNIDIENSKFSANAVVQEITSDREFIVTDLHAYQDGWFSNGKIRRVSDVQDMTIRSDSVSGANRTITLWDRVPSDLSVGDSIILIAGCDHTLATCRDKFGNAVNFQGFPHIPGEDWLFAYPQKGDNNNGGSIFNV